MTKAIFKGVALLSVLNLLGPLAILADDSAPSPAAPATMTRTAPRKHHRRHKKTASAPASGTKTVASDDKTLHTGVPASNTDAPGMSDSLGANNPGTPNMGASDHTPGTTGTSGQ
jgi:hypothetical protein